MIAVLVNKGLDGDMDFVNACEDRIIRGKAKAMIAKVKKGTLETKKPFRYDNRTGRRQRRKYCHRKC